MSLVGRELGREQRGREVTGVDGGESREATGGLGAEE